MSKQKRTKKSADGSVESVQETATTVPPPVVHTSAATDAPPASTADQTTAPPSSVAAPPSSALGTNGPHSTKKKRSKKKKLAERMSEPPTVRDGRGSASKVAPAELDKKLDALEQKLEKKVDAHQAAKKGMTGDPEEISIPPVVEHEHEEQFFADAEKAKASSGMSGGFDMVDPKHAQKMTAAARARRAHLTKYVKAAVAAAAVICLLAFARLKLAEKDVASHAAQPPVTQVIPEVKAPEPVKQADPVPAITNVDMQPIVGDTLVGDAKAVELDTKDAAPTSSPVGVVGDGTAKPKTAWQEKATAKAALESGNNGMAIAAGERSVALDPTDGETWLVLGGAYQASGNVAQSKRCFNSCLSQGKKGPLDECKSMLAQ